MKVSLNFLDDGSQSAGPENNSFIFFNSKSINYLQIEINKANEKYTKPTGWQRVLTSKKNKHESNTVH